MVLMELSLAGRFKCDHAAAQLGDCASLRVDVYDMSESREPRPGEWGRAQGSVVRAPSSDLAAPPWAEQQSPPCALGPGFLA